jgi:hypothetical protein
MEISYRSRKGNPVFNKVYQLWYNMNCRCHNEKSVDYKYYGAKGIKVCDKWRRLDGFIDDVDKIKGFELEEFLGGKLSLDKDYSNSNVYSLESCEFIPREKNNKFKPTNQKSFIATSPAGKVFESNNQSEFAIEHNLIQPSISACLRGLYKQHRGWSFRYK